MSLPREERLRRARQWRLHLIVALFSLLALIGANATLSRQYPWWLWVLTAWAPLLVLHFAWAKGLFDRSNKGS